jgi:molybdenum cofactor cytidylyltransferase
MCTEGVIVAAGQSKRMTPHLKLLLELNGQSILRRSIFSMLPFVSRIIVVTGYHSDIISEHIHDIERTEVYLNLNYQQGMFSSIVAGLSQMKEEHAFFLPADCPFVDESVYKMMSDHNDDIVIPSYQGVTGHPVLFSKSAIQSIITKEYLTLREFISQHPHQVVNVDCPGVLMDIDTPEDYRKAMSYIQTKEGKHERNQ